MFFQLVVLQMRSSLFGLQGLDYMSANSKGSGENLLMHSLARAFAGSQCDKDPFLLCWLISGFSLPASALFEEESMIYTMNCSFSVMVNVLKF